MSFIVVLVLISFPTLAVCAFAIYMGMSGLEKKKERSVKDRKALENQLIWNGMWKFVGVDPATLDNAIRFLLEDQKARVGMSDEERMKKTGLLGEYKRNLYGTNEKDKRQNNDYQREYVPEVILSENPLILPGLESLYVGWGLPEEE